MASLQLARVLTSRQGATPARVVATLLGLAAILIAAATPSSPLANLRNWVFDAYERSWPSNRSEHRTLVIDIDSDSIRHIGQWPWPRDELAKLVETAAAARVIGIDLLLSEPDRLADRGHETDPALAASLKRVPVVLAAAADSRDDNLRHSRRPPPPPLSKAAPIRVRRCRIIALSPGPIRRLPVPPAAPGSPECRRRLTEFCGGCRPWPQSGPCWCRALR